jgi:hypothetical protein
LARKIKAFIFFGVQSIRAPPGELAKKADMSRQEPVIDLTSVQLRHPNLSRHANKVYDPDDNNMEIAAIRWDIADIHPRMISNSGEANPQSPNQLVRAWYLVLEYFMYSTDNRTATRGLALVRHPTQLSRYQRVGVCYEASESVPEDKPWKQCKTLEVTII